MSKILIFQTPDKSDEQDSKIFEKIRKRYGLSAEELDLEFRRRVGILYKMFQNKVVKFEEVQKMVNEYYKNPEKVLRKFGMK